MMMMTMDLLCSSAPFSFQAFSALPGVLDDFDERTIDPTLSLDTPGSSYPNSPARVRTASTTRTCRAVLCRAVLPASVFDVLSVGRSVGRSVWSGLCVSVLFCSVLAGWLAG